MNETKIQRFFNILDIANKQRHEVTKNMVSRFKQLFGKLSAGSFNFFSSDRRFVYNIDQILCNIKMAKKRDSYVSRAINNISRSALKNGFYFEGKDQEKVEKITELFNNIILFSGYTPKIFVRECLKNLISYSNVYIHRKISKQGYMQSLSIMPSSGWTVKSMAGPKVTEWVYNALDGVKEFSYKNIFHYYFNKETEEAFGTPFMLPSLEDIEILRQIETSAAEFYINSTKKKVVVYVGTERNPAFPGEIDEIEQKLASVREDEDLVLDGKVKVEIAGVEYKDPGLILQNMTNRAFSGAESSGSQMGVSGNSGRQDADSQAKITQLSATDFQEHLEEHITNTILRELCLEEFGVFDDETRVNFKFRLGFDEQERRNNHSLNLWQSNLIDTTEARQAMKMPVKYDKEDTYSSNFQVPLIEKEGAIKEQIAVKTKQQNAKVANKANPSNQHGKTGTTKPSVKN